MSPGDSWSTANRTLGIDISQLAISGTAIEGTNWETTAERNSDAIECHGYRRIAFIYKQTETGTASTTWTWEASADLGTTWHVVTTIDGTAIAAITDTATAAKAYAIKVVAPLMRINFNPSTASAGNSFMWNICRVALIP
jgi:hypothetical protein